MRFGHSKKRLAFTLIEVLLAIGIFSMVMAAIYSAWSAILRGTRVGLNAAAEVQRTRVAMRALEESLGSAVMYTDNAPYYSFFAETSSEFATLSFVARLPESFPGSGLFPGQPLRRVEFGVDEQGALVLRQSTVLDGWPSLDASHQPYTIQLAPKVSVFAAEFFDPRAGEWLPEWISTNQLPRLIRVAIGFGNKDQNQQATAVTLRMIPLTALAITRNGGAASSGGLGLGQAANTGGTQGVGRNRGERGEISRGGDRLPPPGMQGGFDDGSPQWQPRIPVNFGSGGGSGVRNPVFPPMPGG